jgi:hypothetical protein
MARLDLTLSLTSIHSEQLEHQLRTTHRGMAHFANTGPFGRTCSECAYWGYYKEIRDRDGVLLKATHRHGCKKFLELTGQHGNIVPASAAACRYFECRSDNDGK